jgi:hypothetical protein
MGTKGPFPGGKASGNDSDHSLSSSAEVKNDVDIHPLPTCVHVVMLNLLSTDNFTFIHNLNKIFCIHKILEKKNGNTVMQYIGYSENLTCVTQEINIIYHTVTESGIYFN